MKVNSRIKHDTWILHDSVTKNVVKPYEWSAWKQHDIAMLWNLHDHIFIHISCIVKYMNFKHRSKVVWNYLKGYEIGMIFT